MTTRASAAPVYDHRAVLALGGNLGNRFETMQAAVDALVDTPNLRVDAISPVYETEPYGGSAGESDTVDLSHQRNYLNAVALVSTDLSPLTLLDRALAIEQALHRVRGEPWGARTIDVDIVAYDALVSHNARLTVPHPRAHQRAFVLVPWSDVEPGAHLPGWGPISSLLAALQPITGVHRRHDLALQL
jgi:2-amino-4-hydroxy-6-hydroxymethyldihydropteridine diphosphokinase